MTAGPPGRGGAGGEAMGGGEQGMGAGDGRPQGGQRGEAPRPRAAPGAKVAGFFRGTCRRTAPEIQNYLPKHGFTKTKS